MTDYQKSAEPMETRPTPAALFINLETKQIESLHPDEAEPQQYILLSDLLAGQ